MGEGEYECEMQERKHRKNNIMISELRTIGKGLKEKIKGIIRKYIDLEMYISRIRPLGGVLRIELHSLENKIEIIKRKGMLKGIDIWIENDWTERQKEVQEWLEKVVSAERRNELETRIGFQKTKVDGKQYEWDDRKGDQVGDQNNLAETRNARKAEKYLKEFEIVILQETWVEKSNESEWVGKRMKDWTWITKPAVREVKKKEQKEG